MSDVAVCTKGRHQQVDRERLRKIAVFLGGEEGGNIDV
jgi:hypothetical protein